MNRNLLPLTLFGVGFLMLYSGYKGMHPIDGVLKPILRGGTPVKPNEVPLQGELDPNAGAPVTPLAPQGTAPVPPPPGAAHGSSSGSGVVNT